MNRRNEAIFDLDGEPFRDFDRASSMRDLLVRETGRGYRIDRGVDENQFVVRRIVDRNTVPGQPRLDNRSEARVGGHGGDQEFKPIVLRPALRTRLPSALPLILLGVFLIVNPISALSFLLSSAGIDSLPPFAKLEWLVDGIRSFGIIMVVPSVWSIFHPWLASRYAVSKTGVSMQLGIFARDVVEVRHRDIRSVSVSQGFFERLMNVGTVQFYSAGDEVDVAFRDIPRPAKIRARIQAMVDRSAS